MIDPRHLAARLPGPDDLALFLDVDGTIIGASHQAREHGLTSAQIAILKRLHEKLGGALAILTGRTIEVVDEILAPLTLPVGGLQGADRRYADGRRVMPVLSAEERRLFESLAEEVAAGFPSVEFEWKPGGMALVYSEGDSFIGDLHALTERRVGGAFSVMRGRVAIDVVPKGTHKGQALESLAGTKPFAGRIPVHVGDDVPDDPAFAAARRLGGCGVAVTRPSGEADHLIADVPAVWALLEAYLDR